MPTVTVIRNHISAMANRPRIEIVIAITHDLFMADTHGDPRSKPHDLDTYCLAPE